MTVQVLFDTARFRDRLTSSGMPEPQARAVTEGIDEALRGATATKADIKELGDRLNARIETETARLDTKIEALGARLDAVEQRLEESIGRRIAEAMAAQSRWIVASMFGGLGLLFAALKLFP